MEYKELSKLFYMDASNERETRRLQEYERRLSLDSTFNLGAPTANGDLFVAMPRELTIQMEQILAVERKCAALLNEIPGIARAATIRGLVLDEVVNTNAIEDIHSTRQQVEEALIIEGNHRANKRFRELGLLYLGLSNDSVSLPRTPNDIRAIYDALMVGELAPEDELDGELFRARGVDVISGTKPIHSGASSEAAIVEGLNQMFALLQRDDIPELIKIVASHFVFEHTHPFYDGNGRTGRYLLAFFLKRSLSTLTVLSLSRAIAEHKSKYYEAFASAEHPLNCAELTFFIQAMFDLIQEAQHGTMDRVEKNMQRFNQMLERCEVFFDKYELKQRDKDILFILAQFDLFGLVKSLSLGELAEALDKGKKSTRENLDALEKKGLVASVSKRPLKFSLTDLAERELGIA